MYVYFTRNSFRVGPATCFAIASGGTCMMESAEKCVGGMAGCSSQGTAFVWACNWFCSSICGSCMIKGAEKGVGGAAGCSGPTMSASSSSSRPATWRRDSSLTQSFLRASRTSASGPTSSSQKTIYARSCGTSQVRSSVHDLLHGKGNMSHRFSSRCRDLS